MKNKLLTVHISDRSKEFIDHLVPGDGFIDFQIIYNHLKEIHFTRPILFEVMINNYEDKDSKKIMKRVFEIGNKILGEEIPNKSLKLTP